MACFRVSCLTFIFLIIAGSVNAVRWLELEPHSTPLISDGIDHVNHETTSPNHLRMGVSNSSVPTTTLYGEEKCESIYGFLPCADTMSEGVFLIIMYTYLMMSGEKWIGEGSHALFILLGDRAFGASVFRVLMALPRIILVIVAGAISTESAAQNQVAFGVSMYAGSTLITLTLIWGFCIILNRDKLRGTEQISGYEVDQEDSSTKYLPLKQKLSILVDNGVNIDKWTGEIALIMLLSLIPFATVEVFALIKSPIVILVMLIVSSISLALYVTYQIWHPWIQARSLAHLKEENLRIRFFYHIQRLAKTNLIDEHGNPNFTALKSIFDPAAGDDNCISHEELELLVDNVFEMEKDYISKEYAKTEILAHFDDDNSGLINWLEFQKGCTKWLKKLKKDANSSNSLSKNLWKQVTKVAIKNKRENLTQIEQIMPRILKQVLEKQKLVTKDGHADKEKIEGFFSQYDHDHDQEIHRDELKEFIETLNFGVSLDHDAIFNELAKDFNQDCNSDSMGKKEFVEGFIKWIDKAISHDPTIKDPMLAIAKFEEDCWGEIDTPINMVKPKASILYVILGVAVMFMVSGAFTESIIQFSNAANIPFHLTSFVVFPIVMNGRMVITSLLHAGPRVSKNASLTFSEIYNGLVMNNLLGLSTLLAIVYIKGLSWTYSTEVLTIMIPCAVVGLFALKRDTYPLWASIFAMLLYPIYVCLYCVFGS